jgi:hypothetical protein
VHSFWLESVSTPVLHKMLDELRAGGNDVRTTDMTVGEYHTVSGSGVTAQLVYDTINQRAQVTITDKPFLVSYSYIEGEVREALRVASLPPARL